MPRRPRRNNTAISAPIDATPERLARAAGHVEISNNRARSEQVVRLYDGQPLRLLLARDVISAVQFEAGERYCAHHYLAGLSPRVSPGFEALAASNGWDRSQMAASERQAYHRQKLRAANRELGLLRPWAEMVLIEEADVTDAARRLTGRTSRQACSAVGGEMVALALKTLVAFWGMEAGRRRA